jgi:phosphate butyryltransferase
MKTMDELIESARKTGRKRIAVAAAQEEAALEACVDAWMAGLAEPVLVGIPSLIDEVAGSLGLDISRFEKVAAKDPASASVEAVRLVRSGDADILMKGLVDTATLLHAAFDKTSGIRAGGLASHVAVMESPAYHKLLFVTDAAINIAPDLQAKVEIVNNAVRAAKSLGVETPKVALLAAVEKVEGEKMPCTVDAAAISQMQRRAQIKGCVIDGPLALDNAISAESARIKKIDSPVSGDVDILVAPDIEAGNILYKCLLGLGGAKGAGIVMGAASPIVLTSRADKARTMLASIAFAVLACR